MVKSTWLEECDQAKKELPVSPRYIASEFLFPKGTSFFLLLFLSSISAFHVLLTNKILTMLFLCCFSHFEICRSFWSVGILTDLKCQLDFPPWFGFPEFIDSTCIRVEPSTDACGIKKVKSFAGVLHVPMVHVLEDKNFEAESLLERKRGNNITENGSGGSSSAELATKSGQSSHFHAAKSVDKNRHKSSSGTMDVQNIKSSNVFRGRTFCFSTLFPQDRVSHYFLFLPDSIFIIMALFDCLTTH